MPLPTKFKSWDDINRYVSENGFKQGIVKDNLENQVFGHIHVLKFIGKKNKKNLYVTKCTLCESEDLMIHRADSLISGKTQSCGCKSTLLSIDRVKKGLNDFGYKILSDFKSRVRGNALDIRCPHNHTIKVQPDKLLSQLNAGHKGCTYCRDEGRRTTRAEIVDRCSNIPCRDFIRIVDYDGHYSNVEFLCHTCDSTFTQKYYSSVIGRGCNKCITKGFKKNTPCYLYIYKSSANGTPYCKVGITIRDPAERIKEQHRNNFEIVCALYLTTSREALDLEMCFKKNIPTGFIHKDNLKTGWTQTFDPEYLPTVMKILSRSI